jgi:RNA polymerase sigma-70 factor (ECF subfamily)
MVKVSNVELAEDMTQEVFTKYWQYLRDGREMTNTRSFLYTIANNMAKDWYKKKKADSLERHTEKCLIVSKIWSREIKRFSS